MKKHITILGTGAYGTALANILADNGHCVVLYGISEAQVMDINDCCKNRLFFGNQPIHPQLMATTDLDLALADTELLVFSIPTSALDEIIGLIRKKANRPMIFLNVAKGFDEKSAGLLSQKLTRAFSSMPFFKGYGFLSGPSMAIEILQKKPTCAMSCSLDAALAQTIATIFSNEYFVVSPTDALVACEMFAALKNTIAIASGLVYGYYGSDNARASLITIGYNEIMQFIEAYSGDSCGNVSNFATLGDLALTCWSSKSRNFSLGMEIAALDNAQAALARHAKRTVEGVLTCKIAQTMAINLGKRFSLLNALYQILYEAAPPLATIKNIFLSH